MPKLVAALRTRDQQLGLATSEPPLNFNNARNNRPLTTTNHQALFAALGIALALPAAFVLTRLMRTVIYGVSAHDPVTFIALPLTVLAVTLTATYVPAHHAARVDPAAAMKTE